MKKILVVFSCLVVLGCNSKSEQKVEVEPVELSAEVLKSDIAKLKYSDYSLDAKAEDALAAWDKYHALVSTIEHLKSGDISFFKNEAKELITFIRELKTSMPEVVQTPAIDARILTLETKVLKLQSVLELQNMPEAEQIQAIKEVLLAFSNLNLQINKKFEKETQNIAKPE
ncbi:hypothetical protein [Formosa sp. S-31]|uniref:hypothetical protein n=1 Tax=Formosa sp. S-31 TaxID=2790949 RepID=UPI003EC12E2D